MEYTIKFKFSTMKLGRGKGQIIGNSGNGECDIVSDYSIDELKLQNQDLTLIAYNSIVNKPNVKKMGKIVSFDIIDIVPR